MGVARARDEAGAGEARDVPVDGARSDAEGGGEVALHDARVGLDVARHGGCRRVAQRADGEFAVAGVGAGLAVEEAQVAAILDGGDVLVLLEDAQVVVQRRLAERDLVGELHEGHAWVGLDAFVHFLAAGVLEDLLAADAGVAGHEGADGGADGLGVEGQPPGDGEEQGAESGCGGGLGPVVRRGDTGVGHGGEVAFAVDLGTGRGGDDVVRLEGEAAGEGEVVAAQLVAGRLAVLRDGDRAGGCRQVGGAVDGEEALLRVQRGGDSGVHDLEVASGLDEEVLLHVFGVLARPRPFAADGVVDGAGAGLLAEVRQHGGRARGSEVADDGVGEEEADWAVRGDAAVVGARLQGAGAEDFLEVAFVTRRVEVEQDLAVEDVVDGLGGVEGADQQGSALRAGGESEFAVVGEEAEFGAPLIEGDDAAVEGEGFELDAVVPDEAEFRVLHVDVAPHAVDDAGGFAGVGLEEDGRGSIGPFQEEIGLGAAGGVRARHFEGQFGADGDGSRSGLDRHGGGQEQPKNQNGPPDAHQQEDRGSVLKTLVVASSMFVSDAGAGRRLRASRGGSSGDAWARARRRRRKASFGDRSPERARSWESVARLRVKPSVSASRARPRWPSRNPWRRTRRSRQRRTWRQPSPRCVRSRH